MIDSIVENFLVAAATAFTNAAHMLGVIIGMVSIAYIAFPIVSTLPLLDTTSVFFVYVLLRFLLDFSYLQFLTTRNVIIKSAEARVDTFADAITA